TVQKPGALKLPKQPLSQGINYSVQKPAIRLMRVLSLLTSAVNSSEQMQKVRLIRKRSTAGSMLRTIAVPSLQTTTGLKQVPGHALKTKQRPPTLNSSFNSGTKSLRLRRLFFS